jgi:hypothetical protein
VVVRPALLAVLAVLCWSPASIAAPADDEITPELDVVVAAAAEVLAINDLCQWNLAPKVEAAFQDGAKELKMSARLQQNIRAAVTRLRKATFANLSPSARARTIQELCTPQERTFLERMITEISFD